MTEPYPPAQIQALIRLLQQLRAELPQLRHIAGHEALDRSLEAASDDPARQVQRKLDPGPRFPWPQVLEAVALAPYGATAVTALQAVDLERFGPRCRTTQRRIRTLP